MVFESIKKLTKADLLSLEEYDQQRQVFQHKVRQHKKLRRVTVGPHVTLYFEDRLTIQYQIQEMLRIEKIFSAQGIQDELDVYNPMIPDGDNWKATMMIEYKDVAERKQALKKLVDIEDQLWVQVGNQDKVFAIADEDLERKTPEKTSSVHFIRFQFSDDIIQAIKTDQPITLGISHEHYQHQTELTHDISQSLLQDLM